MLALISKTVYLPLVFSISIISYIMIRNRFNKIIFSIFITLNFSFHLWWMEFSKSYIKEMYRIRRGELSELTCKTIMNFMIFGKHYSKLLYLDMKIFCVKYMVFLAMAQLLNYFVLMDTMNFSSLLYLLF